MKAFITVTGFGFIVTENNEVVDHLFFDEDTMASILEKISKNELVDEEVTLIESLSSTYDSVVVEAGHLPSALSSHDFPCDVSVVKHSVGGDYVRSHFDDIVSRFYDGDITGTLNSLYSNIASLQVTDSVRSNDVMIVESVNTLEELEDSTGKLIERLREWCTPFVPELDAVHNHQLYARIVAGFTGREELSSSGVLEGTDIILSANHAAEIGDADLQIIRSFAESVQKLYESKASLEEFLDRKILEVAPNLHSVAGSNLAAKLIAHTNGLENLAKLPSSTVQVIGAEKAMFRHLKTGENPPKHGLIFQHPLVRGSNWWVRGRLARAVAGKITIAARKDAFGGSYDDSLRQELEEHVDEIKKNHPFPERKNKKKKEETGKKGKKSKKKGKKKKRNKRKLREGEYSY